MRKRILDFLKSLSEKLISFRDFWDFFKMMGTFFLGVTIFGVVSDFSTELLGTQLRNTMMFYVFYYGARKVNKEDIHEKARFEYIDQLKEDSWILIFVVLGFILGFFLL